MTSHRPRRWLATAGLAATMLVAASCADDSDSPIDDASNGEPSAGAAVDDTAGEPAEPTTGATTASDPTATPLDEGAVVHRIAVVAPSSRRDAAFTQSMIESLERLAQTGRVTVDVAEQLFVLDRAVDQIREYAAEGYDLVIAHGSQFGEPVAELAPEFPDVSFAFGTATEIAEPDNVFSYGVAADQGGFVNGVIAAGLSASGRAGVIVPFNLGDGGAYAAGFEAGFTWARPDGTVDVAFTESFTDVALAAETARAQIDGGADVLTGSSQIAIGGIGAAAAAGIPWLGTQADQAPLATTTVVASQVYRWDHIVVEMLDQIDSGILGGRTFTADLANGGIEIVFNERLDVDPDVRSAADMAVDGLVDGSISTGVD